MALSKKNIFGFTLIELLVVIAIIGLLSTLAIIALTDTRKKARDGKRMADVAIMQTVFELFYDQNGNYPPSNCQQQNGKWVCLSSTAAGDPYWIPHLEGYTSPPPEDPGGHSNENFDQYIYYSDAPEYQHYTVFFRLEVPPQDDKCGEGPQDLFPPDPPRIWSTRCN